MAITTRTQLAERILQDLGEPVIKVNVDSQHVENAIDDALAYFAQFHKDGSHRLYYAVQLTAQMITDSKLTLPAAVSDVIEVIGLGSNTYGFATDTWQIQSKLFDIGQAVTMIGLSDYVIVRQMFDNTRRLLESSPHYYYRRHASEIVFSEGLNDFNADDYLVFECYSDEDPENATGIYGVPWVREYATAKVKKIWGGVLSKFGNMMLAGGAELNGDTLKSEADQEIQALEERLREELMAPPAFFIG